MLPLTYPGGRSWLPRCAVSLAVCLAASGGALGAGAQSPPAAAGVKAIPNLLAPCEVPGVNGKAECGTLRVLEDRSSAQGRKIGLKIVVLRATGESRLPDPIFFIAGGPGESATGVAPFVARELATLRQQRDIVLVDQRGTGGSHPLQCDLYQGAGMQRYMGAFLPTGAVAACRDRLSQDADLRLYTTSIAMDDLDDVRAALGYETIDLYGGSYGTRAALVYIRRHPAHARSAVLHGVDPPFDPIPLHFPSYAQRAADAVVAECAAEASCSKAFPDLAADLKHVIARLTATPAETTVYEAKTGEPARITLTRNLAGEAIRYLMYNSASALLLPIIVHQAAGGDYTPLAEFALSARQQIVAAGSLGMYLSVTCAEDLPRIDVAAAERDAAASFLGDYRFRDQRAACALWPRGSLPADFGEAVRSDVPVLMFSGTWDPVTPPILAREQAKTLPNSKVIVVPAGGHDFNGLENIDCLERLLTSFIQAGSASGLDTSCVGQVRRPKFPVAPLATKPVALSGEELSRLAGDWEGVGAAPPVKTQAENGKLRVSIPGAGGVIGLPVSSTRVRLIGIPAGYLVFRLEDGVATAVSLEQSGVMQFSWKRRR